MFRNIYRIVYVFLAWGYDVWHTYSLRVFNFNGVDFGFTGADGMKDDAAIDEIEVRKIRDFFIPINPPHVCASSIIYIIQHDVRSHFLGFTTCL